MALSGTDVLITEAVLETTDVMHATIPALSFVNCHNLSGQSDRHPGIAASGYNEQMKVADRPTIKGITP